MKRLILMGGLFVALLGLTIAGPEIWMTQGQGVVYNWNDITYGYTGDAGEIYPAYEPLISGYISAGSGGYASVTVTVDTDYPSDYYYVGDLPNSEDFWIGLL